jgi:hypothetical protein
MRARQQLGRPNAIAEMRPVAAGAACEPGAVARFLSPDELGAVDELAIERKPAHSSPRVSNASSPKVGAPGLTPNGGAASDRRSPHDDEASAVHMLRLATPNK